MLSILLLCMMLAKGKLEQTEAYRQAMNPKTYRRNIQKGCYINRYGHIIPLRAYGYSLRKRLSYSIVNIIRTWIIKTAFRTRMVCYALTPNGRELIQVVDDGGTDVEIQAAINRLPATGGELYLCPQTTYTISATISIGARDYVWFHGGGPSTIIKLANNINLPMLNVGDTRNHLVFSDFQMDGNKTNNAGGTFGMYGATLTSCIFERLIITQCKTRGFQIYQVASDGSRFVIVSECEFSYCGADGAYFGISDSIIEACNAHHNSITGLIVNYNRNTVQNNTCCYNSYNGIYVIAGETIIQGNICTFNTQVGILQIGGTGNVFSSNTTCGNVGHGIQIAGHSYAVLIGNHSADNGNLCAGILIEGSGGAGQANYNSIVNNICRKGGGFQQDYGIWIKGGALANYNRVGRNILYGNDVAQFLDQGTNTLDPILTSEPVRALNTPYQNTSLSSSMNPILITMTLELVSGVATPATAELRVENANPPTIVRANPSLGSIVVTSRQCVSFIVPFLWYYGVYVTAGTVNLIEWHEQEIG